MYKPYLMGPPGWVLRPSGILAADDLDFANGRAFARGGPNSFTGLLTTTRASTGYAQTSGGVLVPFATNTPRITDQGLLVEEARTNLILHSQAFDNVTDWTASAGSVTADQTTAPDGTLTADRYSEDGTSASNHGLNQLSLSLAASTTYTSSVYLKYIARRWVRITMADGGSAIAGSAYFDIQNGVVGSHNFTTGTFVSATITPAANGFYRCTVTFTTAAASSSSVQNRVWGATADNDGSAYTGTNAATTYYWQAQLEAGSFATSPIVTSTVAVTRAADAISTPLNIAGLNTRASMLISLVWANNSAIAVFLEGNNSGTLSGATFANNSSNTVVRLQQRTGASATGRGDNGGTGSAISPNAVTKMAMSWDGVIAPLGATNGVAQNMSGTSAPPQADWAGNLSIGSRAGGAFFVNTYIRRVAIWYNNNLPAGTLAGITQ